MTNNNIATARAAIVSEIKRLQADLDRLTKVLASLDGSSSPAASNGQTYSGKKRGRKPGTKNKAKGDSTQDALDLIKAAGAKGINVMTLNAALRKAGKAHADRVSLVATDKIKLSGKAGGAKYAWKGE